MSVADAREEAARLYEEAAAELQQAVEHCRVARSTSATGSSPGERLTPGPRAGTY